MKKHHILLWVFFFLCTNSMLFSQITWDKEYVGGGTIERELKPQDFQLYPRDVNNEGTVVLQGTVDNTIYERIQFRVTKTDTSYNNTVESENTISLTTNNSFNCNVKIKAELSEYKFEYRLWDSNRALTPYYSIAENVVCGDVFIIEGQSNAVGGFKSNDTSFKYQNLYGPETKYGRFSRTYGRGHVHEETHWPTYTPIDEWGRSQLYIWPPGSVLYKKHFVGPWGLYLQYKIQKDYGIPTCFINAAVGSTKIEKHLPDATTTTFDYHTVNGCLNYRVYKAGVENDIKAFFWYQGESDTEAPNLSYIEDFNQLYHSWKSNFNFEKIYICQIHPCSNNNATLIGNLLRRLPAYIPDSEIMSTNGVGHFELDEHGNPGIHFLFEGYRLIGERLYKLLERDWYCKTDNINNITAPNIQRAYYQGNELTLEFDQNLSSTLSDPLNNVINYVNFDVNPSILNQRIEGNQIIIGVSNTNATKITYPFSLTQRDDPFVLKNSKGIGVLSFADFPITTKNSPINEYSVSYAESFNSTTNQTIIDNAQYAAGKLNGHISQNHSACGIFTDGNTYLNSTDNIHLNAAKIIIFRNGFKANDGSYMKAQVGDDLHAFTNTNNCATSFSKSIQTPTNFEVENTSYTPEKINHNTNKKDFKIYPNPTNNIIYIELPNTEILKKLEIKDQYGKTVVSKIDKNILNANSFAGCPKGIYFVYLYTSNGVTVEKVIYQ